MAALSRLSAELTGALVAVCTQLAAGEGKDALVEQLQGCISKVALVAVAGSEAAHAALEAGLQACLDHARQLSRAEQAPLKSAILRAMQLAAEAADGAQQQAGAEQAPQPHERTPMQASPMVTPAAAPAASEAAATTAGGQATRKRARGHGDEGALASQLQQQQQQQQEQRLSLVPGVEGLQLVGAEDGSPTPERPSKKHRIGRGRSQPGYATQAQAQAQAGSAAAGEQQQQQQQQSQAGTGARRGSKRGGARAAPRSRVTVLNRRRVGRQAAAGRGRAAADEPGEGEATSAAPAPAAAAGAGGLITDLE